jgi:fatty acid desaturase
MASAPRGISYDEQARECVRDLHQPCPAIFWSDMLGSALVGWSAFAGAVWLPWPYAALALCVAGFALYRGLCFIHELTHIRPASLPGFETAWNLLFGVPLLFPSFVYVGVHQDHHKLSMYGTKDDPEYMPFARNYVLAVTFVLHSVLIPLMLLLRFLVLAPASFFTTRLRVWLVAHASALSMNLAYRREPTAALLSKVRLWETVVLGTWSPVLGLMATGWLPWGVLWVWYATTAMASLVNTLRTLGAHRYESDGKEIGRAEQLLDSIDTPGSLWTELWAPVGLRYHALHHYFPGIPYHNLELAHRRLKAGLPSGAPYQHVQSPSLVASLGRLFHTGRRTRRMA